MNHNTISQNIKYFTLISLMLLLCHFEISCKKFVEVPPPDGQLVSQNVFASDATATSAILGIYSRMLTSNSVVSIPLLAGLSADELTNFAVDPWQIEFYTNTLSVNNSDLLSSLWSEPYQYIYAANVCIEGITASTTISIPVKNQLLGEAKFIRAFCNFYLVNFFGDVPNLTQSDYTKNVTAKRDSVTEVYGQIVKDLTDAENLLLEDYSLSGGERVRPNKSAVQSLLARVYLYIQNWDLAEQYASTVINKTSYFVLEPNLDSVFLSVSREAIWQLKPNQPGYNTNEANNFIFLDQPINVTLSEQLLNAFEANDGRRTHWIDSIQDANLTYYYAYKYKLTYQPTSTSPSEYSIVLRLAELYLIRAEARAQQNNDSGALEDINAIRNRAGLPSSDAITKQDIQSAILQERRIELFSEWGHRWLDLKRTQTIDSVMNIAAPYKGSVWNSNQQLYPIPQPDRQADPNLSQNPGY